MNHIEDKRGKLEDEVFSYKQLKDKRIFIYWNNKQIKILTEKDSEKFLSKIENISPHEQQLVMAKITGNFKHGNEKQAKYKY